MLGNWAPRCVRTWGSSGVRTWIRRKSPSSAAGSDAAAAAATATAEDTSTARGPRKIAFSVFAYTAVERRVNKRGARRNIVTMTMKVMIRNFTLLQVRLEAAMVLVLDDIRGMLM